MVPARKCRTRIFQCKKMPEQQVARASFSEDRRRRFVEELRTDRPEMIGNRPSTWNDGHVIVAKLIMTKLWIEKVSGFFLIKNRMLADVWESRNLRLTACESHDSVFWKWEALVRTAVDPLQWRRSADFAIVMLCMDAMWWRSPVRRFGEVLLWDALMTHKLWGVSDGRNSLETPERRSKWRLND